MKRQLLLFLLSIVLITVFFLIPRNRQWAGVLFSYANDFQFEKNRMHKEQRLARRFGSHYTFSKAIADSVKAQNKSRDVLILMPPTSYFNKMGVNYHVPEPAVFYYFTNTKTIWANSDSAINANWYVRVINGQVRPVFISDKKAIADTIAYFKSLGVSL